MHLSISSNVLTKCTCCQKLIKEAGEYKSKGNAFFAQGNYAEAITEYENALMTCPLSLNKDRAIYFGNIAACHLKQVM